MTLTARQQLMLLLIIAVAAGGFLSYNFVFKEKLKLYSSTKADVAQKKEDLEKTEERYFFHTNPDTVVEEYKNNLGPVKLAFERNKRQFFDVKLSADDKFPGFTFKQRWEEQRDKLVGRARKLAIFIPENIGFNDAVPPGDQVEEMLNQLEAAAVLLRIALDSQVYSVDRFEVGAPYETEDFVQMFPFQVSITAPVERVVDFMYNLSMEQKYVALHSYQWQSFKPKPKEVALNATFVILAARVLDKQVVFAPVEGEEETDMMLPGAFGFGDLMGRGGPEGGDAADRDRAERLRAMMQGQIPPSRPEE